MNRKFLERLKPVLKSSISTLKFVRENECLPENSRLSISERSLQIYLDKINRFLDKDEGKTDLLLKDLFVLYSELRNDQKIYFPFIKLALLYETKGEK
jgi:hypothetical protein